MLMYSPLPLCSSNAKEIKRIKMNKYSWTIYSWTIHNTYWLILSDIMHSSHPLLLLTIIESATFHQIFLRHFKGIFISIFRNISIQTIHCRKSFSHFRVSFLRRHGWQKSANIALVHNLCFPCSENILQNAFQ